MGANGLGPPQGPVLREAPAWGLFSGPRGMALLSAPTRPTAGSFLLPSPFPGHGDREASWGRALGSAGTPPPSPSQPLGAGVPELPLGVTARDGEGGGAVILTVVLGR